MSDAVYRFKAFVKTWPDRNDIKINHTKNFCYLSVWSLH